MAGEKNKLANISDVVRRSDRIGVGAGVAGGTLVLASLIAGFRPIRQTLDMITTLDTLSFAAGTTLLVGGYRRIWRSENNKADKTTNWLLRAGLVGAIATVGIFGVQQLGDEEQTTGASTTTTVTVDLGVTPEVTPSTTIVYSAPKGVCDYKTLPLASDDVEGMRKLQGALNEAGYDAGPTDGYQGPQTDAALERFKTDPAHPFPVDMLFNYDMCPYLPTLVDGNPDTPTVTTG
jgi:uncharacterized membrane protein YdcZ (DUF606 family)